MCSEPPGCRIPFRSDSLGLPLTQPHFPVGFGQMDRKNGAQRAQNSRARDYWVSFRDKHSAFQRLLVSKTWGFCSSIPLKGQLKGYNEYGKVTNIFCFVFPHLWGRPAWTAVELHFCCHDEKHHTAEWLILAGSRGVCVSWRGSVAANSSHDGRNRKLRAHISRCKQKERVKRRCCRHFQC